mgnify:CR=1 FL=1
MRRTARAVVGVGIAVAFLALLVSAVGWGEFADALAKADPRLYGAALVAATAAITTWAQVTRQLFASVGGELREVNFHSAYFSALFGRAVLPGGHVGGVGIVAYVLSVYGDGEFERPLVAVSTAEFSNNVASVTMAALGLLFVVTVGHGGSFSGLGALALVGMVAALAAAYALVVQFDAVGTLAHRVAAVGRATVGRLSSRVRTALSEENVEERVSRASDVAGALRDDPRTLASAVAFSHLGWAFYVLPLYLSLRAVGTPVAFGALLLVVPVAGLAAVLGTPGGIGVVDSAMAGALVALTPYPAGPLVAGVVLYRVADFGTTICVGGVSTLYLAATDARNPLAVLGEP